MWLGGGGGPEAPPPISPAHALKRTVAQGTFMERAENPDPGPLPITLFKLSPRNGGVDVGGFYYTPRLSGGWEGDFRAAAGKDGCSRQIALTFCGQARMRLGPRPPDRAAERSIAHARMCDTVCRRACASARCFSLPVCN